MSQTPEEKEVLDFLQNHIKAIMANDTATYTATTSPDLSLYEWYIMPHRIDGLDFHYFIMNEAARRGTNFQAQVSGEEASTEKPHTRYDLCNLRLQLYGDTAIASYTLLQTTGTALGVTTSSHHESRVMLKRDGQWQVVHVHKSPSWSAPYMPPVR
ncbi:MAG: protein kinase [Chloroflexi bacterium]|uniref:Protein kinase n=1 Tax=Candidatus Chlorohelix allophototropha TaxID=3003348 RepID=A0A8T7M504_9CHLR|nr:protein kinase [Chloroflexota bacterium]WJW69098.1 hypothetical protein OZ401_002691 [Chloroflexota bacterium L227-S17]